MAWSDPRTWAAGELVTAALMNAQVRDAQRQLSYLIASTVYDPGIEATYTTTSATFADMDSTNLSVTFTAPYSGIVIVQLQARAKSANTASYCQWNLRESSSNLSNSTRGLVNQSTDRMLTAQIRVSGLTAGTSHTYKWGHASSDGATTVTTKAGGSNAPATIDVWAA